MKFIKTYWHNLTGTSTEEYYQELVRQPVYQFALSSLMLSKYHDVELYTDIEGAKLVSRLCLPFSKIIILEKVSDRYKSINDLYVLSLQEESATLIGDEILANGPLHIKPKRDSIIILGIELNSFKLVKSIIKIRRVNDALPFLEDALWPDKMSYVDTAVIGKGEDVQLEEYVTMVLEFLDRHAEALTRIPFADVDNFIKRYWLYSYFRMKEISIETYFKDPLSVPMAADPFCFSKNNIIQNIVKILDHYLIDEQFSIHFFQYFKLHFKTTFELLGKDISEKWDPSNIPHIRLKQALNKFECIEKKEKAVNWNELKTRELKQLISQCSRKGSSPPQFLPDLYDFEENLKKAFKNFIKIDSTIEKFDLGSFTTVIQNWHKPPDQFMKLQIKVNPYIYLHESKWKWATHWVKGMNKEKVAELKVVYNMHMEPTYFITAFVFSSIFNRIYEINIDRITAQVITGFEEGNTIDSFYDYLAKENLISDRKDPLWQVYQERVRALLLINIFYIDDK